jgi:hypothetical protein
MRVAATLRLYPACRRFAAFKAKRKGWRLSPLSGQGGMIPGGGSRGAGGEQATSWGVTGVNSWFPGGRG